MTTVGYAMLEYSRYKHARFSARFPKDYRYSLSHYWMALVDREQGIWRVGFTKFATRMLGELVEADFEVPVGGAIASGQEIGWVEGFKAASNVYSVIDGEFLGMNPILAEDACIIRSSPYEDGFLYEAKGSPEANALDVSGYEAHLDSLIAEMEKDPKYADE